jgi:transcriptional regulator with XRE-family HTH domain
MLDGDRAGAFARACRDRFFQEDRMQIEINDMLRSYIDPLTEAEYTALERSILAEGCRDALVLWNEVLVDGHNRYAICQQHSIPFKVTQNTSFRSMEDVMLWMIDNHLGRRSVSDFQRGVLALRKKDIIDARSAELAAKTAAEDASIAPPEPEDAPAPAKVRTSREDIARAARLSSNTLSQIEKIQKTAAPELVEAVRAGTISINAAATVASLPEADQVAAVAGGKKLLQQAAKEIREQRAASRPAKEPKEGAEPLTEVEELRAEVAQLKERMSRLRNENAELRERIAQLVDAS